MQSVYFEAKGVNEFEIETGGQRFTVDRNEMHNIIVRANEALRQSVVVVPRMRLD